MSGQADIEALITQAKAGRLKPLVLIYGDQDYLVRQTYDRLLETLVPEALRDFNLEQHDGARADPQVLLDSLATPPLLPGPKAVGVYDARYFQSKANAGEILEKARERFAGGDSVAGQRQLGRLVSLAGWTWSEAVAADPEQWSAVLELEAAAAAHLKAPWFVEGLAAAAAAGSLPGGSVDDAGVLAQGLESLLAAGWPEGIWLICAGPHADMRKKLGKLFADYGTVLDFRRIEKAAQSQQAAPYLRQRLNQLKLKMPISLANRLIEAYGSDLGLLDQELAKLADHAWPRTELDEEDLAAVGSPRPEEDVFRLIDAVAAQRLGEALRLLRQFTLADPKAVFQLMNLLVAEVRKLLLMRALLDANLIPTRGAGDANGFRMQVYPKVAKELPPALAAWWKRSSPYSLFHSLRRARGFRTSALTALVFELAAADVAVKTGRKDAGTLLEELCVRLCGVREESVL